MALRIGGWFGRWVIYPQTQMTQIIPQMLAYARGLRKTRAEGSTLKHTEGMRLAQANTDGVRKKMSEICIVEVSFVCGNPSYQHECVSFLRE